MAVKRRPTLRTCRSECRRASSSEPATGCFWRLTRPGWWNWHGGGIASSNCCLRWATMSPRETLSSGCTEAGRSAESNCARLWLSVRNEQPSKTRPLRSASLWTLRRRLCRPPSTTRRPRCSPWINSTTCFRFGGTEESGHGPRARRSGRGASVYRTPDWDDFVALAVTEIRHYGRDSIQVARRMRAMLEDLIEAVPHDRAEVLKQQLDLLHRSVERGFLEPEDRVRADIGRLARDGGHTRLLKAGFTGWGSDPSGIRDAIGRILEALVLKGPQGAAWEWSIPVRPCMICASMPAAACLREHAGLFFDIARLSPGFPIVAAPASAVSRESAAQNAAIPPVTIGTWRLFQTLGNPEQIRRWIRMVRFDNTRP